MGDLSEIAAEAARSARREYAARSREKLREINKRFVRNESLRKPWYQTLRSAKERSRQKKLPFNLTDSWALDNWTGQCSITGIPFSNGSDDKRNLFRASIDRVVPGLGYIIDNCRFVLSCVNSMKHDGTDEEMLMTAKAVVKSLG
jgi:hypothetical protein